MRLNERLKKLENQTSPIDWSKVKIYNWENTPEEFVELARQEAAGETVVIRLKWPVLRQTEDIEPPGSCFKDIKLKPGQKIAIIF